MIPRSAASGQLDKVAQGSGTDLKIVYCRRVKEMSSILVYTVHCPALNETENCASQDHAIDVAYSMYRESNSTVWVEDYLGYTVIELGD
jgi:hypothetical protein